MSKWDWLHAGLEIATYGKARKATQQLAEMESSAQIEAGGQALLEAMRSYVFDISRDIKLAEEQISNYPQQVYIVSRSLEWRLSSSGLTAGMFPDFQDKEYVFATEKKIAEVIDKTKEKLTKKKIHESDVAVQHIIEMPLLQQTIPAKYAQDSLNSTDDKWQILSKKQSRKKLLLVLGIVGWILVAGIGIPLVLIGLLFMENGGFGGTIVGLIMIAFSGFIPILSIALLVLSGKPNPEYKPLKSQREDWQNQLLPHDERELALSSFGDLTAMGFSKIHDERAEFINSILGTKFQEYLVPRE